MDYISIDLLNACDLILNNCKQSDNTWGFEEGSEAHLALVDAITQALLVLGIDIKSPESTAHEVIAVPTKKIN
jgi:hypothetical protein